MKYTIGIDTGTHTGMAVYDHEEGRFVIVATTDIISAIDLVRQLNENGGCKVIYEDARLRKWYGKDATAKLQGAGSIKRDCEIWEKMLRDNKIEHHGVHPIKGATKRNQRDIELLTGWKGRTSEHARDAILIAHLAVLHDIKKQATK